MIGGGVLLGLVADRRVGTRHVSFRLGVLPHGLSPVLMATKALPALVGEPFSLDMYLEDLTVDGPSALRQGILCHLLLNVTEARSYAAETADASCTAAGSFAMTDSRARNS